MQKQKKVIYVICIALMFFYVIDGRQVNDLRAHNQQTEIGQLADGRKIYQTEEREGKQLTPFGYGSSKGKITWQGIYATPMITIEGVGYVYCTQPQKQAPNGNIYDQGTLVSDQGVKALLQAGFPYNKGNLTNREAYIRTFVALNGYLGTFNRRSIESYGDAYVNQLLKAADHHTIEQKTLTVVEPTDVTTLYNEKTKRLETKPYEVKGMQGKFWLEQLPHAVYPINEKGEAVRVLPIGTKFRIATDNMTLNDKIDFKIHTDIKTKDVLRYQAVGVQDVMTLQETKVISPIVSRVVVQPHVVKMQEKKEKLKEESVKNKQPPIFVNNMQRQPILVKTGQSNWYRIIGIALFLACALLLAAQCVCYSEHESSNCLSLISMILQKNKIKLGRLRRSVKSS